MASRTKQKEEARARRLAEEQEHAERAQRQRRFRMLGGIVIGAVAVVGIVVAISAGGGGSSGLKKGTQATALSNQVNNLLAGIPQSGNTIGNPNAPVTVTEYGDLECPVCKDFALAAEQQLIANEVRSGKAKLVYRSLETATGNGPNANQFGPQQAAALAAGMQNKAWNYIELFYHEQGAEGTGYVTPAYLQGLAKQVPGLDYTKWQTDSQSQNLISQVTADEQSATSKGYNSTPTIVVTGPKGTTQPIVGNTDYGTLQTAMHSVQ
jgi:protein-disulfide isomerase